MGWDQVNIPEADIDSLILFEGILLVVGETNSKTSVSFLAFIFHGFWKKMNFYGLVYVIELKIWNLVENGGLYGVKSVVWS